MTGLRGCHDRLAFGCPGAWLDDGGWPQRRARTSAVRAIPRKIARGGPLLEQASSAAFATAAAREERADLGEDVGHLTVDGVLAQHQRCGDLRTRLALRDESEYLRSPG